MCLLASAVSKPRARAPGVLRAQWSQVQECNAILVKQVCVWWEGGGKESHRQLDRVVWQDSSAISDYAALIIDRHPMVSCSPGKLSGLNILKSSKFRVNLLETLL